MTRRTSIRRRMLVRRSIDRRISVATRILVSDGKTKHGRGSKGAHLRIGAPTAEQTRRVRLQNKGRLTCFASDSAANAVSRPWTNDRCSFRRAEQACLSSRRAALTASATSNSFSDVSRLLRDERHDRSELRVVIVFRSSLLLRNDAARTLSHANSFSFICDA